MAKNSWKMPKWMEKYRPEIVNTGGNPVEELMVDNTSAVVNMPRAVIASCVKSQVALLEKLHEKGVLL